MEQAEHIAYWLKSAEHDLQSAETLFQQQRYDWCLFLGHLVIEKMIKAFFVRDNPNVPVPWIHKIAKLAERTKLQLTPEQQAFLIEINDFNIQARYPDYKFEFYKKCTPEFTQNYFAKIKELYQWLQQQI